MWCSFHDVDELKQMIVYHISLEQSIVHSNVVVIIRATLLSFFESHIVAVGFALLVFGVLV